MTYSYQINVETNFKLVKLENTCQAYSPNLILPSGNQMSEEQNGSLIKQRFFNYDMEYTAIFPNFHLMQTFNITHLTAEQLDTLSDDLSPIKGITIKIVTSLLKKINKNYPYIFPTYGYILASVVGTVLVLLIIRTLCYVKYRRAKAMAPRSKLSKMVPPTMERIELQTLADSNRDNIKGSSEKGTSKQKTGRVTPLLIKEKLGKDLGVDFSSYDKFKKTKAVKAANKC